MLSIKNGWWLWSEFFVTQWVHGMSQLSYWPYYGIPTTFPIHHVHKQVPPEACLYHCGLIPWGIGTQPPLPPSPSCPLFQIQRKPWFLSRAKICSLPADHWWNLHITNTWAKRSLPTMVLAKCQQDNDQKYCKLTRTLQRWCHLRNVHGSPSFHSLLAQLYHHSFSCLSKKLFSGIYPKCRWIIWLNPFTPKLIMQILLTIQEQMYEWCSENW